ncbi:MAG: alcohol dehydrogenase catalytic domain-containing protein [Bdellovibrionales bacterium]|nr:alcohol dehydrogenase catalytic domain-containing protein [Bdellovibrionales bacterium]
MTMPIEKFKASTNSEELMWAVEYQGPGKKALVKKSKPAITDPTDAVVKVLRTTICGTDLHILKGDVPTVTAGRILGHEGIGVIESVGGAVTRFKSGDKVLISCVTSDGRCDYCKRAMYSHCENGGWILGNKIDGTQAEFVRIPYADTSLYSIPEGANDDSMVLLSDILPTGFECGVLKGRVKPGDVVAIVGAGPIGLAALLTAQFYSPSELIVVDTNEGRLKRATEFGATHIINSETAKPIGRILELTKNRGVDVAIEAVGVPATFDICQNILAPGGHLANIGVHGKP